MLNCHPVVPILIQRILAKLKKNELFIHAKEKFCWKRIAIENAELLLLSDYFWIFNIKIRESCILFVEMGFQN